MANPGAEPATVNFYFTDPSERDLNHGWLIVPAGAQLARFLDQAAFSGDASFSGTFTWASSIPIGVTAVREILDENTELMTPLPVARLDKWTYEKLVLAHFADGGGWTTQVVLVNPSDDALSGTVRFLGQGSAEQAALPVTVTVGDVQDSRFSFELPPRSSRSLTTAGIDAGVRTRSVRIVPSGESAAPSAFGIFTHRTAGKTIITAGAPALVPARNFRIYAEGSGDFLGQDCGSTMTGITISNPGGGSSHSQPRASILRGHTGKAGRNHDNSGARPAVDVSQPDSWA